MELLCSSLGLMEIGALCEKLGAAGATPAGQLAALQRQLEAVRQAQAAGASAREVAAAEAAAAAAAQHQQEAAQRTAKLRAWDEEEVGEGHRIPVNAVLTGAGFERKGRNH